MSSLAAMPKDPEKITVQAHLSKDEYKDYKREAEWRQWSDKRLNENLIRWFLYYRKHGKMPPEAGGKREQ